MRAYISVRRLPESLQPCHVRRVPDLTLLVVDPSADRCELVWWLREHLSRAEREHYRRGYGFPPDGPLPDCFFECVDTYVPRKLQTVAERRRLDTEWRDLMGHVG